MKKGVVVWLTGLPCSGKTTIANELVKHLKDAALLDGDEIRETLSADLGFSEEDRKSHLFRVAYCAKYLTENGIDVVCAFVSPYRAVRDKIREMFGKRFVEVWVDAPISVCEERDVKGMWAKAKKGDIDNFTGLTAPYEEPLFADVTCETSVETVQQSSAKILEYLNKVKARALFIGRWQPFHQGHRYIIQQALDEGLPVLVAVRDMLPDTNNPFSAQEVKYRIEKMFANDDVEVIIIPDINSVIRGRKAGYSFIEVDAPVSIQSISGTFIRKQKGLNTGEWDKDKEL